MIAKTLKIATTAMIYQHAIGTSYKIKPKMIDADKIIGTDAFNGSIYTQRSAAWIVKYMQLHDDWVSFSRKGMQKFLVKLGYPDYFLFNCLLVQGHILRTDIATYLVTMDFADICYAYGFNFSKPKPIKPDTPRWHGKIYE